MDTISLEVQKRDVYGKKNKALRRDGITPAHVFGHGVKSQALQVATPELERVVERAGKSRLVGLKIEGEKRSRNVIVREVQRKPSSGLLFHVDFYQLRTKEKITVEVPVHVVGHAPALENTANKLEIDLPELTVECLPAQMPSRLDVDVTSLAEPSDVIRVGDLKVGEGVSIHNDAELVVVKIVVERKREVEPVAAEEVEVVAAAGAVEEGTKEESSAETE
jgi:large subunit ribosomal protein L25